MTERNIEQLDFGIFKIQSFTDPGIEYVVDLLKRTCTCPHHYYRKVNCKHIKEAVVVVILRDEP